jgi:hypothetical protein
VGNVEAPCSIASVEAYHDDQERPTLGREATADSTRSPRVNSEPSTALTLDAGQAPGPPFSRPVRSHQLRGSLASPRIWEPWAIVKPARRVTTP